MGTMLRRVREAFGEDSEEYRLVKNEERRNHRQALCVMLGLVADKKFQPKSELIPIRGILSNMSIDKGSFEDLVEKKAQEVSENTKRWGRPAYHSVLQLPGV